MKKTNTWLINLLFYLSLLLIGWVSGKVFLFASFHVPTSSMAPTIWEGDYVLVNKLIPGPRLFNLFETLHLEQVDIYRPFGLRKIRHNDIVVFNNPYPCTMDTLEMHILNYFVKRCIGLPGDTLLITNGIYQVKGLDLALGKRDAQELTARQMKDSLQKQFYKPIFYCYPYDSLFSWNILNFGPLYIPKAGDRLLLSFENYMVYHKLIEWEQKSILEYHDSIVYLNHKPITSYTFLRNYYFMAGDYVRASIDSRYWGLLPEEYIVGKVWLVWKSIDTNDNEFRWNRFMKFIP